MTRGSIKPLPGPAHTLEHGHIMGGTLVEGGRDRRRKMDRWSPLKVLDARPIPIIHSTGVI